MQDASEETTSSEQEQRCRRPPPPLGVGLLGAGIFATKAHAPVLRQHGDKFQVVGIWSRRLESAQKLAKTFQNNDNKNDDDGASCQAYERVDDLINNPKIQIIIMALPIQVQPEYVRKVLQTGRLHLLSEKPIAPTVQIGKELLEFYDSIRQQQQPTTPPCLWSVAENYRMEPGILAMAKIVQSNQIGYPPHLVSMTVQTPFAHDNPYLQTKWRQYPTWHGGLFVDVFVHASAMLRTVLGTSAHSVAAHTSSHANHIPSVDTLTAIVTWKFCKRDNTTSDKATSTTTTTGVIAATFACPTLRYELQVIGCNGSATLSRRLDGQHGWKIVTISNNNETTTDYYGFGGVEGEILDFARHVQEAKDGTTTTSSVDNLVNNNSPKEALEDLKFVEACLDSGKAGGSIVVIQ